MPGVGFCAAFARSAFVASCLFCVKAARFGTGNDVAGWIGENVNGVNCHAASTVSSLGFVAWEPDWDGGTTTWKAWLSPCMVTQ
jgi:hypothetical protein